MRATPITVKDPSHTAPVPRQKHPYPPGKAVHCKTPRNRRARKFTQPAEQQQRTGQKGLLWKNYPLKACTKRFVFGLEVYNVPPRWLTAHLCPYGFWPSLWFSTWPCALL